MPSKAGQPNAAKNAKNIRAEPIVLQCTHACLRPGPIAVVRFTIERPA